MIFRRKTWSVDSGILIFIWYKIPSVHASILLNSFITPWSFKSPWFSVWRQTYSALSNVNIGKISEWKVSVLDAPRIRFPAIVPAVRTALLPIFAKWLAIKKYHRHQTKWSLGYLPRGSRFGLRSTALSMKVWIQHKIVFISLRLQGTIFIAGQFKCSESTTISRIEKSMG